MTAVRHARSAGIRIGAVVAMGLAIGVSAVLIIGHRGWSEGSVHGPWRVVYTGFGSVSGGSEHVRLSPAAARSADRTHGALVVGTRSHGDIAAGATITTRSQLRAGTPNPWEVGWFLWHYTDPSHFMAVVLKPNGWEISKQDPAYPGGQRFLASAHTPAFAVGTPHRVQVVQRGATVTVSADGVVLATVTDQERPYTRGAVALYTEDAVVDFTDMTSGAPSDIR